MTNVKEKLLKMEIIKLLSMKIVLVMVLMVKFENTFKVFIEKFTKFI